MVVAETANKPVRFSEIYKWTDGQFAETFRAHPKGVFSECPIRVRDEYVRRLRYPALPGCGSSFNGQRSLIVL